MVNGPLMTLAVLLDFAEDPREDRVDMLGVVAQVEFFDLRV